MKASSFRLERQIAFCLVVALLVPVSALAATTQQITSSTVAAPATETSAKAVAGQNSSTPGTPSPTQGAPEATAQAADRDKQTGNAQTLQPQQQNPAPAALGTAAAPYETQTGVSGSKPAGAAIAPGKQRRTRSFAIRVALIIGAAAAVGVVTAASLSSRSRPN